MKILLPLIVLAVLVGCDRPAETISTVPATPAVQSVEVYDDPTAMFRLPASQLKVNGVRLGDDAGKIKFTKGTADDAFVVDEDRNLLYHLTPEKRIDRISILDRKLLDRLGIVNENDVQMKFGKADEVKQHEKDSNPVHFTDYSECKTFLYYSKKLKVEWGWTGEKHERDNVAENYTVVTYDSHAVTSVAIQD